MSYSGLGRRSLQRILHQILLHAVYERSAHFLFLHILPTTKLILKMIRNQRFCHQHSAIIPSIFDLCEEINGVQLSASKTTTKALPGSSFSTEGGADSIKKLGYCADHSKRDRALLASEAGKTRGCRPAIIELLPSKTCTMTKSSSPSYGSATIPQDCPASQALENIVVKETDGRRRTTCFCPSRHDFNSNDVDWQIHPRPRSPLQTSAFELWSSMISDIDDDENNNDKQRNKLETRKRDDSETSSMETSCATQRKRQRMGARGSLMKRVGRRLDISNCCM